MTPVPYGCLAALRDALAVEPFARGDVDPRETGAGWGDPDTGAGAWWLMFEQRARLVAVGAPAAVAPLVERTRYDTEAAATPPARVTLPRGTAPLLPERMRPVDDVHDWDWLWTPQAPPVQPAEDLVTWLPASAAPAVEALLEAASPTASAHPGDREVVRWCGVWADAGEPAALVAVAAHTERVPGRPHLASVAVRPEARQRGLGGAVTAWITRQLLAEGFPEVSLGMYAWNEPARRLYRRLGYRDDHPFTSGLTLALAPATLTP